MVGRCFKCGVPPSFKMFYRLQQGKYANMLEKRGLILKFPPIGSSSDRTTSVHGVSVVMHAQALAPSFYNIISNDEDTLKIVVQVPPHQQCQLVLLWPQRNFDGTASDRLIVSPNV